MRPDMAIGLGEFSEAPAPLGLSDLAVSGTVEGEAPAPVLLDALDGGERSDAPSPIGEEVFSEGLASGFEAPAPQFFEASQTSANLLSEAPTPEEKMGVSASEAFVGEGQASSPEPIETMGECSEASVLDAVETVPEPLSIDDLKSMG